jgi:hypothetical protein
MPIVMPPVSFDVPAIIQVASHYSGAATMSSAARAMPHLMPPIARPSGIIQGPDVIARPRAPIGSQGIIQGPDGIIQGPDVAASTPGR